MNFIVVLISIAIERYSQINVMIRRFDWFKTYLNLLEGWFGKNTGFKGMVGVLLILLPLLIITAIIYYSLDGILFGLIGFLLAIAILVYCFGPGDLYYDIDSYFVAKVQGNDAIIKQKLLNLTEEINPELESRAVTQGLFYQFNRRIFAVIFWFVVFGPLGAVLYRVVSEIVFWAQMDEKYATLGPAAQLILDILDWIPVRILSLGYALMGDFLHGFSFWLKHIASGLNQNIVVAEQSGLVALRVQDTDAKSADIHENKEALALIDRTLVLFLVLYALFVLGAWIY